MEQQVLVNNHQGIDALDLMAMQGYAQAGMDHLVADTVVSGMAYTGMAVSGVDATTINVTSGRFYRLGAIYAAETLAAFDLTGHLPASAKRAIAVVAWGGTVEDQTEPRDYIVDLDTGLTETQAHPTRRRRVATVELLDGVSGLVPALPTIPADALLVAVVIVTPAGIESITQRIEQRLQPSATLAAYSVDLVFSLPARAYSLTYNDDGSVDTIAETLASGESRATVLAYNVDGTLDTAVITTAHWVRTETYTYDGAGSLESVAVITEEA